MIKPLESLGELEQAFDDLENEPSFSRIKTTRNRTMPVRSHSATNNGKRRYGHKRPKLKSGMQRRYNKKVLHSS